MPDIGKQRIQSETEYLEQQRRAGVMVTVGKLLLLIDLILACFVYDGLQAGSHLYLWWVIGQFIVGMALLAAGLRIRAEAGQKLLEMSPKLTWPRCSSCSPTRKARRLELVGLGCGLHMVDS